MKLTNNLKKLRAKYPKRTLDEVHTVILALIGALAFIVATYYGFILNKHIPSLIDATNTEGITVMAIGLWSIMGIIAIVMWFYGCIAARCHGIIYDRMFKGV